MIINYPGLTAFLLTLLPIPGFYFIRYVCFEFLVSATKGSGSGLFWIAASFWIFAPSIFAVLRIVYSQLVMNLGNPWWDKGLGYLSVLSLAGVAFLFLIVSGASLAGRGL